MVDADLVKLLRPDPRIIGLVGSDGSGKTHAVETLRIELKLARVMSGTKYRDWGHSHLIEKAERVQSDTLEERAFYRMCAAAFYTHVATLSFNNFPLLVDSEPVSKWLMWEVIQGTCFKTNGDLTI